MSINEIRIRDEKELMDFISELKYDKRINRHRGYYLYRGLPDEGFHLETSLKRNCKSLSNTIEKNLLNNFAKYMECDSDRYSNNIWYQMTLGQHHGLPTRLLDWTHSPLVALHFSVSEDFNNLGKHDCVVWRIDIEKLHELLPVEYQRVIQEYNMKVFSVEMLEKASNTLEEYDRLMDDKSMVILEPPSIDPRIVNQYAFFSVIPSGIDNIEEFFKKSELVVNKYIINKELKWYIRDFLDEANISERTIYPGMDGVCAWLKRHYFVRDDI